MKRLILPIPFLILIAPALAQSEAAAPVAPGGNLYGTIMIVVLLVFVILLFFVALVLLKAVQAMEQAISNPVKIAPSESARAMEYDEWKALQKTKPSIWNKLLGLKPIEEEDTLKLEEDYDGITELDNPTPAWFMVLFYATIVFAVVYLSSYHVFGWGKLQDEEYSIEMEQAKTAQALFLAKAENMVDESSVKETSDPTALTDGKSVFTANCVTCHGDKGQGVVGPNLTDEYWLHGGKVGNLFKTIKYGVPEKGMISWESKLSPKQIANVSNYILSLQGTKPANGKAAQGVEE